MTPRRSNKPAQILSALLFLLAQIQLLIHHTEIEAHAGESDCEICVHFGQLGHGLVAEVATIAIAPAAYVQPLITRHDRGKVSFYGLPQPRAPPASVLI